MTQSGNFKFHTPIFRVNNRQENIDFYQNTLGFKLLTEENALAVFTDWTDRNSLFVIEESPAYRCRAVEGPKKKQYCNFFTFFHTNYENHYIIFTLGLAFSSF